MVVRIGRTLPPAASPINFKDIASGIAGFFRGQETVRKFEEELKSFYRVRHAFSVSSGKAALVLILKALRGIYPERDEVLIPAYTCYSVPSAIIRAGCKVRLCDMGAGTLDFDYVRIGKELESPRILCVIPTHLFGLPADVARVKALANERNIFVLEDAAQAMGGVWNGKKMGTLGDVGFFSLGRGKAFSTVEGGLILTDNDLIGRMIEKQLVTLKGYGLLSCLKLIVNSVALLILIEPGIYWLPKALPFLKLGETHFDPTFPIRKLSSFQAGMAKNWVATISRHKAARSAKAVYFDGSGLKFKGFCRGAVPDLIRFPVMVTDKRSKEEILRQSTRMGLGISDGYPSSIDGIAELSGCFYSKEFPVAKEIAERIVTLPVHSYVSGDDAENIMQLFKMQINAATT